MICLSTSFIHEIITVHGKYLDAEARASRASCIAEARASRTSCMPYFTVAIHVSNLRLHGSILAINALKAFRK